MLKGLGALGDMAGMMKKAQEMQGKMAKMQEELHNVLAAIKDAQGKASERAAEEMSKLTDGLGLPAGMKLPF